MNIHVAKTAKAMGVQAAAHIAEILRKTIAEKGSARLLLSTGASQFETLAALIKENLDWPRVEMFHLDEYVGLPESHKASFRKYLKTRFVSKVPLKAAHFVQGDADVPAVIAALTRELAKAPIDVGVIGIGENAHVAFNDPPADFSTKKTYIVVTLDKKCKQQQVGEGWFAAPADVPARAITMTVSHILRCRHIISCVPHAVKAKAVLNTLTHTVDPAVPASILKTHPSWHLYLDADSAAGIFPVK
ncbi:MAG: glucosamine-6-phosphate deaminase [Spirochaetales bacterium]|jgi:glucosamine-6-phosphate deaminase|nr:glucosamine-6-phosphate deaminase [Spirochaetales bacterium]